MILFMSCSKDNEQISLHSDYFNLNKGAFIDYEVIDIVHDVDALIQHDTNKYFLRTVIGDTFIDNQGRTANEFLRFKRSSLNQDWQLTDTWTAIISENRAELVEENQRYIKLVFPPSKSKSWNPNAFNSQNPQEHYYKSVHESYQIDNIGFDSTVFIEQDDYFSLVDRRKKHEIYAKGIGLVHKYSKDLKILGFDTTNVQYGKELYYTYLNHGVQ